MIRASEIADLRSVFRGSVELSCKIVGVSRIFSVTMRSQKKNFHANFKNVSLISRYFPFDEQRCPMKFGSWTHDESRLDMRILTNASSDDIYTEHGEWQLLGIEQKR